MPRDAHSPYDADKPWLDESRLQTAAVANAYQEVIPLTHAEIAALPSTAKLLVEAAGDDLVIIPVLCAVVVTIATEYTGVNDASWNLVYGASALDYASATAQMFQVLSVVQVTPFLMLPEYAIGAAFFDGIVLTANSSPVASWANQGLYLKDDVGSISDYGAGGSGNSAIVSLEYRVWNVATGRFE